MNVTILDFRKQRTINGKIINPPRMIVKEYDDGSTPLCQYSSLITDTSMHLMCDGSAENYGRNERTLVICIGGLHPNTTYCKQKSKRGKDIKNLISESAKIILCMELKSQENFIFLGKAERNDLEGSYHEDIYQNILKQDSIIGTQLRYAENMVKNIQ